MSRMPSVAFPLAKNCAGLAERYATPLLRLESEVATLAARVEEHLERMGASWK